VIFSEIARKGTMFFRILQIFKAFFAEKYLNYCYFLGLSSNIS